MFILHVFLLNVAWKSAPFAFDVVNQNLPLTLLLWVVVTVLSFAACALIARVPILRKTIGF